MGDEIFVMTSFPKLFRIPFAGAHLAGGITPPSAQQRTTEDRLRSEFEDLHSDISIDPGVALNAHSCEIISHQSNSIEIDETVHDGTGADT